MSAYIVHQSEIQITQIVKHIQQGHLLAIPTETVYGLAANAADDEAIKKIFLLKNRPTNHPLIVHIAPPIEGSGIELAWERELALWSNDVPAQAIVLAKAFWPGPLTIILKKAKHVSDLITGGQSTVGIRVPRHPWTIQLLQAFGGGLVAPSANRFGRISPTTATHVFNEFNDFVQAQQLMILDGGDCEVGIESTILDLSRLEQQGPIILRPGMISEQAICKVLGVSTLQANDNSIRHSGGMLGHYAPQTPLITKDISQLNQADFSEKKMAVVSFIEQQELKKQWPDVDVDWYQIPRDVNAVAKELYRLLRDLDNKNYQKIIFDQLPLATEWAGLQDRLTRSVFGSGVN